MSEPRITIPKSVKHDHDHLRRLLLIGMAELYDDVEVHVKARNVRYRYECSIPGRNHGGHRASLVQRYGAENVRRVTDWGPYLCSGVAYHGIPGIARVEPGTKWLVTLTIPNPEAYGCNTWPMVHVYPGKTSAAWPRCTFERWEDDVVHTAAHEARHVLQFQAGDPCSEVDAEKYAERALAGAWI